MDLIFWMLALVKGLGHPLSVPSNLNSFFADKKIRIIVAVFNNRHIKTATTYMFFVLVDLSIVSDHAKICLT